MLTTVDRKHQPQSSVYLPIPHRQWPAVLIHLFVPLLQVLLLNTIEIFSLLFSLAMIPLPSFHILGNFFYFQYNPPASVDRHYSWSSKICFSKRSPKKLDRKLRGQAVHRTHKSECREKFNRTQAFDDFCRVWIFFQI